MWSVYWQVDKHDMMVKEFKRLGFKAGDTVGIEIDSDEKPIIYRLLPYLAKSVTANTRLSVSGSTLHANVKKNSRQICCHAFIYDLFLYLKDMNSVKRD